MATALSGSGPGNTILNIYECVLSSVLFLSVLFPRGRSHDRCRGSHGFQQSCFSGRLHSNQQSHKRQVNVCIEISATNHVGFSIVHAIVGFAPSGPAE
jgi:hypothetical protein